MTLPPIPYFGSKGSMAPVIASLLPPHTHYVEVFAGSLAVLLAKRPSTVETVNDLDGDLVTFWRCVRDQPRDLMDLLEATPHSRVEFETCAPPWNADLTDLERARRVWVYLTQGRNATTRTTGWRRLIETQRRPLAAELRRFRERIHDAAHRIRDLQIECRPALDLIEQFGQDPNVLIYADPPYLAHTRGGPAYRHEMGTVEAHEQMLAALNACKASVVISGYRSTLYNAWLRHWWVEELPTQTANGGSSKPTCEVLWSNTPLGGREQLGLFEVGSDMPRPGSSEIEGATNPHVPIPD